MNVKEQEESRRGQMSSVVAKTFPNVQGYEPRQLGLTHDIYPLNVNPSDIIKGTYYAVFVDDIINEWVYINILDGIATRNEPDELAAIIRREKPKPRAYPGNISADYDIEPS